MTELFEKQIASFGITLQEDQREKLMIYYRVLVEWNEKMNLTAITEFEEVLIKHFLDSFSLVRILPEDMKEKMKNEGISIIDVGTGAGLPGIPLAILFPSCRITLMDSLNKRILFLEEVIRQTGLKNCTAIHSRAEELARNRDHREKYDLCVSRAVANLSVLSEYCIPFVRVGGCFIPYKAQKVSEEMKTGEKAIRILGGKLEQIENFILPETEFERTLLLVKKEKFTAGKYPRKAGIPAKTPLS